MNERLRRAWSSFRWRLIVAQMAVVLVGIVTLVAAMEWALRTTDSATWQGLRVALDSLQAGQHLPIFRQIMFRALVVAATASAAIGLITSLLLTNGLLRPLNAIARGSRRIARGHYGERVALPGSTELATVATSFNQMAASLAQIEQQRVLLIGDVSHELRTPLAGLGGFLEGLMDGVIAPDAATFHQMDQEVRRLQRLVEDLQELSRIEAGQLRLDLRPLDLRATAQQVIQRLAPQAAAKQIAITLESDDALPLVRADADRTVQLLMNLVGNGIRYTPEGGAVQVALSLLGPMVQGRVTDTGIGIAPDALPMLFERFYRADPSRDRRTGGSGIGLTVARHLAWAMGGDLSAESAGPGKGSTFRFTLPAASTMPDA